MQISVQQLEALQPIERVVIQSLDLALYRVVIEHKGETYWLADNKGQAIKSHNLMGLREILAPFHIEHMVLQHQSAYDEMIGQPPKGDNLLEVTLGKELYPEPRTLN